MEKNVLDKIVDSKKLPVLFIGSGISKRYLFNYPTWDELLELSFKKYNSDIFQLQKHKDALFRQNLSDFEINAKLASIIENEFNAAFFDRKIKLNIGNAKNPEWVKRGISPYKMFLSSYFKKMHLRRGHLIEQELERFKQLKNKISAIITTNYDLFLETFIFPDDYTVFTNQTQLFNSDSYNIAEIYKIHGSATDANSIIITEQDYRTFNDSRKLIIAKMLTLFAESPIVFLHIDPLSHLGAYIEKHNSIDLIITKKIQKSLKNVPTINNFNDLLAEIDNVTGLNKKAGLLLKNITSFNISKIREICKRLYSSDKEEIKTSTHFKRCVMYIDLMENYF